MSKAHITTTETIRYNGNTWTVTGKVFGNQWRVYRIEGDITSPDLHEALQLHADAKGLEVAS